MSLKEISKSLSIPNFSTVNDANAEPITMALFIASQEVSSEAAKYPINPPAKVSPAPVGSKTSSSGSAGA